MSEQKRVVYLSGSEDTSYVPEGFVAIPKGSILIDLPERGGKPNLEDTPGVRVPQIHKDSFVTTLYDAPDGSIYGLVTFDVDDVSGAESYEVRFT